MLKTILLALLLLTLPACSALKVQQVAPPTELVSIPPEPIAPDPITVTNDQFAAYTVELWFWGKQMESKLKELAAR